MVVNQGYKDAKLSNIIGSYNICIIYLDVTEARLKVTIVIFYFCHLKNTSNIMENIFSFHLYIF